MKTRSLLAAACAALLLLAGCTREMKTAIVSDEVFVPQSAGSETGLSVDYHVEYVTGGLPNEAMDKINAAIISDFLYDAAEAGMSVPDACRQWLEALCDGYEEDVRSLMEEVEASNDWMFNWSYSIDGAFTTGCKARGWQSYCSSAEDYEGGAHGMYGETHMVFDLATGERIREEDLLDPDYDREAFSELLYDRLMEDLDDEQEAFGMPAPNGNFSVSEKGVTWYYNPYEIASFALGVVGITVSWADLKPFLQ